MANTDLIARIYAAEFLNRYYEGTPWLNIARNESAQIASGGDTVRFPKDTYGEVWTKFTKANAQSSTTANFAIGAPTIRQSEFVDLIVDDYYRLNELVTYVSERQIIPSLMAKRASNSARKATETINREIRDQFAESGELPSSSELTAISTTAANFGNDAHATMVVNTFRQATKEANVNHFPMTGRFVVMSPSYYDLLTDKLERENKFLVRGGNDALFENNLLTEYKGWRVTVDDSMPSAETASTDNHWMYFMNQGQGIGYAEQMRNIRVVDNSELYEGVRLLGLMFFGAKLYQPEHVRVAKTTIT